MIFGFDSSNPTQDASDRVYEGFPQLQRPFRQKTEGLLHDPEPATSVQANQLEAPTDAEYSQCMKAVRNLTRESATRLGASCHEAL